jgi:ABC-type Fe3+/spermidine/putrescine transport system ATPase subunit
VAVRNEAMETLHRAGATVVLVTHDQGEALAVAVRVAVMQAGRIVQVDSPAVVFHEPASEFAAAFLGEADFLAGWREGAVAHTVLGAVPVGAGRNGPVRVLLRPHHVTAVAAASDTSADGAPGTVEHVEFRGGVSLHVLRLVSGESVRALLPYSAAFTAGDPVVVPVPRGVVLTAFDA